MFFQKKLNTQYLHLMIEGVLKFFSKANNGKKVVSGWNFSSIRRNNLIPLPIFHQVFEIHPILIVDISFCSFQVFLFFLKRFFISKKSRLLNEWYIE